MSDPKPISTTQLSKRLRMQTRTLFSRLLEMGFIEREGESWELTDKGLGVGGAYRESDKYGRYITWPENLQIPGVTDIDRDERVGASRIGQAFGISAVKTNHILAELGWIEPGVKGWLATNQGDKLGAFQEEDARSGIPYVRWPAALINNPALVDTVHQVLGISVETDYVKEQGRTVVSFQEKFATKQRTADGHFVRSKAEMIIDNWLYFAGIAHAYERRLPVEEEAYSDFYLPVGRVYVEYIGDEVEDEQYAARKRAKSALYAKHGLPLIELDDGDVGNLDEVLARRLLKFGIVAY